MREKISFNSVEIASFSTYNQGLLTLPFKLSNKHEEGDCARPVEDKTKKRHPHTLR
jgi:hypothetical protein